MRPILLFCTLLSLVGLGWTQTTLTGPDSEVGVYFLVDASGTMEPAQQEAETKLEAAFELLESGTKVSVTFFGGKLTNLDAPTTCDDAVVIAEAKRKEDGIPDFPDLGSWRGETSIGKALHAALKHGRADANIVVITDGVEECNSDFVSIRKQFPRAKIDLVQVGNRPNTALNLLEILPQDVVRKQSLPIPLPVQIVEAAPEPPKKRPGYLLFLEKWCWLLGFFVISLNAMILGLRRASKSVQLERDIKKFERLQNDRGEGAKDMLNDHINHVYKRIGEEKKHYHVWRVLGRYIIAAIAILALLLLATLSPSENLSGFDLNAARNSAWVVLNSDFATAFAVTWIALLFFYGSQSQRRREALKDLEIATESANRLINEKRHLEHQKYEAQRKAVGSLLTAFKEHRENQVYTDDGDTSLDLNSDYNLVLQEMEQAALGKTLELCKDDEEDEELSRENRKLKILIDGSGLVFSQEATLPRFIERLIETEKLNSNLLSWRAYASAVKMDDGNAIRLCLRNLAEKLRST